MHVFVKAELLAVELDCGVDVVDDVTDPNRGHSGSLLPFWTLPVAASRTASASRARA
jgi:hypothetical protein